VGILLTRYTAVFERLVTALFVVVTVAVRVIFGVGLDKVARWFSINPQWSEVAVVSGN
jgi:hypothetical protein